MSLVKYVAGLTLVMLTAAAIAQDRPPSGPEVRLDQAKKIADDDTQTGGVKIAIEKARTAAMLRRPTKVLEDAIAKGRVIGGIGVSGVNSDQDAQVAQAGLNALK